MVRRQKQGKLALLNLTIIIFLFKKVWKVGEIVDYAFGGVFLIAGFILLWFFDFLENGERHENGFLIS